MVVIVSLPGCAFMPFVFAPFVPSQVPKKITKRDGQPIRHFVGFRVQRRGISLMMHRVHRLCLLTMLLAVVAHAQHVKPNVKRQDAGGCAVIDSKFGPLSCPNGSSCGSYYTLQTEECNIDNEEDCEVLVPITVCCGKYATYEDGGDNCAFAKMKEPNVRSQLVELAKDNEILVPTCKGAYVPTRIAFREHKEMDHDRL
jgi:hypothetical protein